MLPRKSTEAQQAPARAPAGPFRKPQADLYTVLLVIALLAVLVGILFLYLEMNAYEFKYQGGPSVAMPPAPSSKAVARSGRPFRAIGDRCFPPLLTGACAAHEPRLTNGRPEITVNEVACRFIRQADAHRPHFPS